MAPLLYFKGIKELVYAPVPSLEYVAAVKLAIALWNCENIRVLLNNYRHYDSDQNWNEIKANVKKYLKELWLPEAVKSKVAGLIEEVGFEIFSWKNHYETRFEESNKYLVLLPSQMYWKVCGTIDRKKTAQAWVKDCNVPVDLRYKISCTHCFESEVAKLWNELPHECKGNSGKITNWSAKWRELVDALGTNGCCWHGKWSFPSVRWKALEHFWNLVMEGEDILKNMLAIEDYHLVAEFLVEILRFDFNLPAFDFFFPKLTEGARSQFLEIVIADIGSFGDCHEDGRECFFFMLSLLDEEQQRTALLQCCRDVYNAVILHCVEWPRQDFFMQVINCLWPLMDGSNFYSTLAEVACSAKDCERPFEPYFEELWEHSPEEFKQYVVNYCANSHVLLTVLVESQGKKNISLIWKYATAEQKESIINFHEKYSLCSKHYDTKSNKWYGIEIDKFLCWIILFQWLIELGREERRRKFRHMGL